MTVYSDCEPFELTANLELREVLVCDKADKTLTLCTSPATSSLRHWNKWAGLGGKTEGSFNYNSLSDK